MEERINNILKELNKAQIRNENLQKELSLNDIAINKLNAELEELLEYSKITKKSKNID